MSFRNPTLNIIGGEPECLLPKDINFYARKEGLTQLVASYNLTDLPLASLPTAPDNTAEGLTFQEWNFTLAEVNALTGIMEIGATYKTTDGKTKAFLTLTTVTTLTPTISFTKTDTSTLLLEVRKVSDDSLQWSTTNTGTGAQSETVSGIVEEGDYYLTMDITVGTGKYGLGGNTLTNPLIATTVNSLTEVFVGDDVNVLNEYAFYLSTSLKEITIPNTTTLFGTETNVLFNNGNHFRSAWALRALIIPRGVLLIPKLLATVINSFKYLSIPNTVTTIGSDAFEQLGCIERFTLPNSVTSISDDLARSNKGLQYVQLSDNVTIIEGDMFVACDLQSVTFPAGVTEIQASAFASNYNCLVYDFSALAGPPTLVDINAFSSLNDRCKILVKTGTLATWQVATNWVTYADYMKEV